MRPRGRAAELYAAFSRICARAFVDDRLLACPTLSKAPNYGQVLRRFILGSPRVRFTPLMGCKLAGRYVAANGLHCLFLLLSALFARCLGWRNPLRAQAAPPLIIDTFAVLPRIAAEKRRRELYLPGLAEAAVAAGRRTIVLHRLYGSRDPRLLWRAMRVLAAEGNGLLETHLFTLRDWLHLVRHALVYPFPLIRLIRSLDDAPAGSAEAAVRDALMLTAGQCVLIGEARRIAARRLGLLLAQRASVAGRPAEIVSWYENQTVNKCFQRGLAQAEAETGAHIPVTGAQLFIWPDALLNNHPNDAEAVLGLAPDRVLVNGPHFLPDASSQKYAVGPSLRYGGLFSAPGMSAAPSPSGTPGPLLVLLSYHPDEVRRVLSLVLPLAEAGEALVYRFHPATDRQHFTAWLPPSPRFSSGSLQEALAKAGAVIGSGSGSLAEAAACGIPVLSVEDALPDLSLNYLPDFGKAVVWESVREREDIVPALEKLREAAQAEGHAETVRKFRDLLFTEPTAERIADTFGLY